MGVWEAWEKKEKERRVKKVEVGEGEGKSKGKGKRESVEIVDAAKDGGVLVVFACRHIWHRSCLIKANLGPSGEEGEENSSVDGEGKGAKAEAEMGGMFKCPLCV